MNVSEAIKRLNPFLTSSLCLLLCLLPLTNVLLLRLFGVVRSGSTDSSDVRYICEIGCLWYVSRGGSGGGEVGCIRRICRLSRCSGCVSVVVRNDPNGGSSCVGIVDDVRVVACVEDVARVVEIE